MTLNRWPPLNLIRGFEAAGRLESFSKAADELEMTQSAISHQIRVLEEFLGQPLFKRIHRRVVLTDAGHDLLLTVQDSLQILGEGVKRLDQFKKPNQIIVSTTNGFAAKWLLPRLPNFRHAHPKSDIWLYTTDRDINFDFPVCAPNLLPHGPVSQPKDLLQFPLLHDERWEDWAMWFAKAGLEPIDTTGGPNFSDHGLTLQAAISGQGVALGSSVLAADDLEHGRLVCPYDLVLNAISHYYLVAPRRAIASPRIKAFIDWLRSEAGGVA